MAVAEPKTKNAVAGNFALQICFWNLFLLLLKSPLLIGENTLAEALLSSSFLLAKIALLQVKWLAQFVWWENEVDFLFISLESHLEESKRQTEQLK